MGEFDRIRWLDISSYEKTPEENQGLVDQCSEDTWPWHNLWSRNIGYNMYQNGAAESIESWMDIDYGLCDGPCIVCGAGPSLSRGIEAVKRAHDLGTPIIAVDRAYRTLKAAGIKPFITVSIDAQVKVKKFFEDVEIEADEIFALSIVSHPDVVALLKEKANVRWTCPANPFSGFWLSMYMRYGDWIATVRSGSVVTYTAVDIALWMGYGKKTDNAAIITTGNELSWETEAEAIEEIKHTGLEPVYHEETGRYTFKTFTRALSAFTIFPHFNDEVNWIDISGGLLPPGWTRGEAVTAERSN